MSITQSKPTGEGDRCRRQITGPGVRKKRTPVSIQNHQKRMSVFVKKCLTNGGSGGIICKLSDERLPNSLEDNKTLLKTSKNTKKVLDKFLRMC